MTKVLTPDAQSDRDQFEDLYGYGGNCSCHLSAPCGSCTHHGNPFNQEEDDECWMDDPEEQPTGYVPKLMGCTPEEAAGHQLLSREKACPTMGEAEKRALLRCIQECADVLGLDASASPADVVFAVKALRAKADTK